MNQPILILYGTVTGNAERCAHNAATRLQAEGLAAMVRDMQDVSVEELQRARNLLVCVSTTGEGNPPDGAEELWKSLMHGRATDLSHLRYSVLALGDSSYQNFCQCGRDFDAALARQGAQRLARRVDADVPYKEHYALWIESVTTALKFPPLENAITNNI